MKGDILLAMTSGIDSADVVVVCITREYINKCKKAGNDNCKLEFEYAYNRKGVNRMVAVVMEPDCAGPQSWDGSVGAILGLQLYVGATDSGKTKEQVADLAKEIRRRCDDDDLEPIAELEGGALNEDKVQLQAEFVDDLQTQLQEKGMTATAASLEKAKTALGEEYYSEAYAIVTRVLNSIAEHSEELDIVHSLRSLSLYGLAKHHLEDQQFDKAIQLFKQLLNSGTRQQQATEAVPNATSKFASRGLSRRRVHSAQKYLALSQYQWAKRHWALHNYAKAKELFEEAMESAHLPSEVQQKARRYASDCGNQKRKVG
jgi:tetratricopeptide (TPR) repeat protein